jgi:hypothetical protein
MAELRVAVLGEGLAERVHVPLIAGCLACAWP